MDDYTPCRAAIKSQLAGLRGRRGKPLGSAVIRDFMKHGSLTYSYGPATLKAALHQIGPDAAQYSDVLAAVQSQQLVARRAR